MNDRGIRSSEHTDKIDAALAKLHADIDNPAKDKTATVRGKSKAGVDFNYSYKYTDIADILTQIRPLLSRHAIAIPQAGWVTPSGYYMLTTRVSCEGQWIEGDHPVCPAGPDPQAMGAALTYARRYGLCAMLGIAAEEDTDASHMKDRAYEREDGAPQDQRGNQRTEERSAPQQNGRKPGPTSAELKKEGAWERYTAEMKAQRNLGELKAWADKVAPVINTWPKKWIDAFKEEYAARAKALKAGATAPPADDDGGPPR